MRMCFSESIIKLLVEIVLVLENRMRIFIELQFIPTRTDIAYFMAVLQDIGFSACAPRCGKDQFFYFRMVVFILDVNFSK